MVRAPKVVWSSGVVIGAGLALIGAGCTGTLDRGASSGSAEFDRTACEIGPRSALTISRLTRQEYDRSVEALTGVPSTFGLGLPADGTLDGLERGGPVAPLVADQLLSAAEQLADEADLGRIVPCDPAAIGEDACARATAVSFARRAYRRPASEAEIEALLAVYFEGRTDPSLSVGFADGIRWMIAAALSAPQFLYHEWGELSGEHAPSDPLHGYAMASRLSYFLWGSTPDDALLDAAEAGALSTAEGVAEQARRLLGDPRARAGVRSFFRQWLHVDRVGTLSKDPAIYPSFDANVPADLEASLYAFTEHAFWEGGYHELESSSDVWLNGRLSALYGVEGGPSGDAFEPFALDVGDRAGLYSQPAILAMLATPNQGHPIRRGVFVRENLLCQDLRPPPNDVATPVPALDAAPTTRERFAAHVSATSCRGCHQLIDGIGFSLERFDGIGAARETENGVPVDDSGTICSFPNCDTTTEVVGAVGLADALSETGLMRDCITREWMRYAAHAPIDSVDRCELARISDALGQSDDLGELLVAIASSELLGNPPTLPAEGSATEGGE